MVNRSGIAITAVLTIAASAIQPVFAQGYYGAPPGYDAPPPAYAPPPSGYEAPPPGYNAPPQGYGAPPQGYYGPPPAYAAPSGYGPPPPPPQNYAASRCEQQREGNTAGGAILGAIAGGLFGNAVSRGHGAGTAVGAIAGGLLGASIGSSMSCNSQRYATNVYVSGFEAGRPHHRYDWRSPYDSSYGYLEVGDYYRGPEGRRCATYTQRIFVDGRPEVAAGRACRQDDGSWQMIG
jgi:surface antigen